MKNLLLICLLFVCVSGFSKGYSGYYFLEGTAYSANENILKNALLSFTLNEKNYEFNTDDEGNFKVKVIWVAPCRSGLSHSQAEKLTAELNPEKIHFSFKCQGTMLKNYWKDFIDYSYREETNNTKYLDLHFQN